MIEIEISLRYDEEEDFEHEGYYYDIDSAIKALLDIKKINKEKEKMS